MSCSGRGAWVWRGRRTEDVVRERSIPCRSRHGWDGLRRASYGRREYAGRRRRSRLGGGSLIGDEVQSNPSIRRLHARRWITPVSILALHSIHAAPGWEGKLAIGEASVTLLPRIMRGILETSRIDSTCRPPLRFTSAMTSHLSLPPYLRSPAGKSRGGARSTDSAYPRTHACVIPVPQSDIGPGCPC